jgi:MFS family permease
VDPLDRVVTAPASIRVEDPGAGGGSLRTFLRRQQRDWAVTVGRTSLDRLAYQMVFPYLSIYIVGLGATATQLGLVNSLGMLVAGLAGPLTGWLIDRHGPRPFYLVGIGLLAVSYGTYALA